MFQFDYLVIKIVFLCYKKSLWSSRTSCVARSENQCCVQHL